MDPNHNAFDDSAVPPTVSPSTSPTAKANSEGVVTTDDPIAAIIGSGPYPIEAYEFVQEGLRHTVDRILRHTRSLHGATETVGGGSFDGSMHGQHDFDGQPGHMGNVGSLGSEGNLGNLGNMGNMGNFGSVNNAAGSPFDTAAEFNFANSNSGHITGQQLCIGLREYAIHRYGMLAPVVLRHWNVLRTEDFGRIVYRLIDIGLMSRTPDDSLSDFAGVYEFDEVFGAAQLASRVGRN